MDWRDSADRIERSLANEPTEKMQPNEATEPTDRIDPAEPMLRIEPEEPMDRIDPLDPMLRIEPAEPPDRRELPVNPMPGFSPRSALSILIFPGISAPRCRRCPSRGFRSSSEWTSRKGGSRERPPDGEAMIYTLPYQLYKYERGLTAAEQRAADVHAGEIAAAARDLRVCLGRAFRLRHRVRPARGASDTLTVPVRFLSSARQRRGNALHADPR